MQEELEKEGIWDFNRLIKPYVRRYMLQVWLILHFSFILVVVCVLFASIFPFISITCFTSGEVFLREKRNIFEFLAEVKGTFVFISLRYIKKVQIHHIK